MPSGLLQITGDHGCENSPPKGYLPIPGTGTENYSKTIWRVFLAVFLTVCSVNVAAAQTSREQANPCDVSGLLTDVRPDNKGPANKISIGLRVIDVREINDVDQTITVDFAVRMRWLDERLVPYAGCRIAINRVWFPNLVLANSGRLFYRWPEEVSIEENGRVTYLQRKSGTFSSHHELLDFPFDHQEIELYLFPLNWSEKKVVFERDEDFEGIFHALNISDWQILGVSANVETFVPDALAAPRSGYRFTIEAKRYINY